MGRVRKNPEERREELAAAALALFCSQGYGVTQVKDICTRARVAKGTFFYYFSTKEAVLQYIFDEWARDFIAGYLKQVKGKDAVEKIRLFLQAWKADNPVDRLMDRLVEEQQNSLIRRLWNQCMADCFDPVLLEIFRQGIREQVFHMEFPQESLAFFWALLDVLWPAGGDAGCLPQRESIARKQLENLLGMEPDSLRIFEKAE